MRSKRQVCENLIEHSTCGDCNDCPYSIKGCEFNALINKYFNPNIRVHKDLNFFEKGQLTAKKELKQSKIYEN